MRFVGDFMTVSRIATLLRRFSCNTASLIIDFLQAPSLCLVHLRHQVVFIAVVEAGGYSLAQKVAVNRLCQAHIAAMILLANGDRQGRAISLVIRSQEPHGVLHGIYPFHPRHLKTGRGDVGQGLQWRIV